MTEIAIPDPAPFLLRWPDKPGLLHYDTNRPMVDALPDFFGKSCCIICTAFLAGSQWESGLALDHHPKSPSGCLVRVFWFWDRKRTDEEKRRALAYLENPHCTKETHKEHEAMALAHAKASYDAAKAALDDFASRPAGWSIA